MYPPTPLSTPPNFFPAGPSLRAWQGGVPPKKAPKRAPATAATTGSSSSGTLLKALLPVLIVLVAIYFMQLQQGKQA